MVPYYGYGVQTSYMLYLFFNFFVIVLSLLSYHYYLHDQKTGVALFDGFKIELRLNLGPPKLVCPNRYIGVENNLYQILVILSYLVYVLLKIDHFTQSKR